MLRTFFIVVFVINFCSCSVCDKCACKQETNDVVNLPLFKIDCSRLEMDASPSKDALPKLIGILDLSHNEIEQLNETSKFSSTTLRSLDYSYNKIKIIVDGYFDGLVNLTSLNLEHNYLKFVKLTHTEGLSKLKGLNLAWNYLVTIPRGFFKNLRTLQELILSHNDLGSFLSRNSHEDYLPENLTALYLDGIKLETIEMPVFYKLENMKILSVSNNPLNEIFPLPFPKLEYLDISGTNITVLKSKDLYLTSLKTLKMRKLPNLRKIENYAFHKSGHLEELIIEDCKKLDELDPLVFGGFNESTVKKIALKNLSLARNSLTGLVWRFRPLFMNLETVNLEKNPWDCSCYISWMVDLRNVKNPESTR